MNLFEMTFKQIRQRWLATWLTLLSVALGMALVVGVMLCRREAHGLFGQSEYGFDVLVGAKGSPLQLVLNSLYHMDKSPGNIPWSLYEQFLQSPTFRPYVKSALPMAVGDSYMGRRIVATLPQFLAMEEDGQTPRSSGGLNIRPGQAFALAQGRCFHGRKFEAVIGSDLAAEGLLSLGSTFHATHGLPALNEPPDIHQETWRVVGILQRTQSANDRVIFIPLKSFYAISEHEEGMEKIFQTQQKLLPAPAASQAAVNTLNTGAEGHHYQMNPDGTFTLLLPRQEWLVSAVLVNARGPSQALGLVNIINNVPGAAALIPAEVMRAFFSTFLAGIANILLVISALVVTVADVGILVSIYNSVIMRRREIAIFRALGATRPKILAMICLEAGLIGLVGSLLGLLLGHGLGAAASIYTREIMGQGIAWAHFSAEEIVYLLLAVVLAVLAGLIPALAAYKTPVATNLTAGG